MRLFAKMIVILPLFLVQCEDNSLITPDYQGIVIQGYLYEGEPVTQIRITETLPIGDTSSSIPPINDAVVTLMKGDTIFELSPTQGDSGYYHYEGNDLVISESDLFTLKVAYFGIEAYGSTSVPPAPKNSVLTDTVLYLPKTMDFEFDSTRHEIKVSWDIDTNAMYFVYIENVEEDPVQVNSRIPPRGLPGRMVEMPMNQNFYPILFEDITHYGLHRIRIYRINKEYVDLYISRNQNTRELNEPLTNIVNGLGVFSAFNHTDIFFRAISE
jgi:hypothetical protein